MSKSGMVIPRKAASTPLNKRREVGVQRFLRRLIKARKPLCYDGEDIEEANRIGAVICRQHAR